MKLTFLMTAFVGMCSLLLGTHANSQNGTNSSPIKITASGVWQPPQEIFAKATKVCQTGAGPQSFSECYMNQLAALGEVGPGSGPGQAVVDRHSWHR